MSIENLNKINAKQLANLYTSCGTDKVKFAESYAKEFLPFFGKENLKIFEIGIRDGSSHRAWSQVFSNSEIYGIDIDERSLNLIGCENFKFEIFDQGDVNRLQNFAENYGPFDIIIDDGSHFVEHMTTSFECLIDYLNPGGIYVIEDIGCTYINDYHNDAKNMSFPWGQNLNKMESGNKRQDFVDFTEKILENIHISEWPKGREGKLTEKNDQVYEKISQYKNIIFVHKRKNTGE